MHPKHTSIHAMLAALLLAAGATHAIDASWTGGNGNWSDGAKWSTNPDVPDQADDIARLGGTSTGVQTTLDQADVVIGQLINARNTSWTINEHASEYGLGLQATAGSALIHATSAQTVTLTVNPDIVIASDLIVRSQRQDAQTQTVTLNGSLTGTGNVTLEFTGGGNNAYGNITLASLGSTGTLTVQGDNSPNGFMTATVGAIGSGVTTLTKTGSCRLILTSANSYTGATTVNGGILRGVDGTSLTSSLLTLGGGAFETSVDFTRALGTGANNVRLVSGGTVSGFSARDGAVVVALGGLATPASLTWGSDDFAPTALILNTSSANAAIEFRNAIDLNAATRTVQVDANVATLAGVLSNASGTAGLTKTGSGVLVLAGANSYNGTTQISRGILRANDGTTLPGGRLHISAPNDSSAVFETGANLTRTLGTGAGQVSTANGNANSSVGFSAFGAQVVIAIGGLESPTALTWNQSNFGTGNTLILNATTANDALEFKNAINLGSSGTNTRKINTGANVATVSGALTASGGTQSLTKTGDGTLVLSNAANNYNGTTTVSAGVLRANDGASLPATGNLNLAGGVLEGGVDVVRNGGTAAGQIQITAANSGFSAYGASIVVAIGGTASPTALTWGTAPFSPSTALVLNAATADNALELRNAINLGSSGTNTRTVQTAAGVATVTGALSASGGTQNLTKTGAGTLVLANAANSYNGTTTVSAGTLLVNGSLDARTTTVTANAGATLGGTGTINRPVTIAGTLAPGGLATPGTLTVDLGATTGKVTLNSGAKLAYRLAGGTSDALRLLNVVAGDMVLNDNVIDFTDAGGLSAGTYTLMAFYSDGGSTLTDTGKPTGGLVIGTGLEARPGSVIDYSATGLIRLVVAEGSGTVILVR